MTLTVGSLFSGIGGLELGLEATGMKTLWQVEKNPYCQSRLAKHWPDVVRYADVKDVGIHNLAPVDVICGGFPCQDISYAGKGAGLDGHRSGLWYEYARIVRELGPKYVVVENVPALLTRGIDQVLGTLADLGYDAEWTRISAADVGAPHLRQRIFIVAYSNRGRREQRDAGLGHHGESGAGHLPLVDTESGGRGEGRGIPARRPDGGREGMGDTDGQTARRQRRTLRGTEAPAQREGRLEHRGGGDRPLDAGEAVGHADRAGLEQQRRAQPVRSELGSAKRRGTQVRDWSDATPIRGADGTIRLIPKEAAQAGPESPLWPVADGIPGRVARLSAIGNAVIPKVAEQVGHRIHQLEEQLQWQRN